MCCLQFTLHLQTRNQSSEVEGTLVQIDSTSTFYYLQFDLPSLKLKGHSKNIKGIQNMAEHSAYGKLCKTKSTIWRQVCLGVCRHMFTSRRLLLFISNSSLKSRSVCMWFSSSSSLRSLRASYKTKRLNYFSYMYQV